jgi:hypothetical protein
LTIHQIQVRYDAHADRLLLQVRTVQGEIYPVWLTRRLVSHMLVPLRKTLASVGVAAAMPQALPVPEARQMLEDAVLQRPLPGADFAQPFADQGASHPLGQEPLLPANANLTPRAGGVLTLAVADAQGRQVELNLPHDMATALLRLVEGALAQAEWNLGAGPAPGTVMVQGEAAPPRLLN